MMFINLKTHLYKCKNLTRIIHKLFYCTKYNNIYKDKLFCRSDFNVHLYLMIIIKFYEVICIFIK